jgi:hypothetical protein
VAVFGLVIAGSAALNVMVKVWFTEPAELLAVTVTLNSPFTDGVPEIRPVEVLMPNPAGNPVAE